MELLLPRIERLAIEDPARIAISSGEKPISYGELMASVRRLQTSFTQQSIGKGAVIALLLPNAPEFVLSHLALLRLGAVTMPLHPKLPPSDIEHILRSPALDGIIADRSLISPLGLEHAVVMALAHRFIVGDVEVVGWQSFSRLMSGDQSEVDADVHDESELAAIILTAGVMGPPRPVELTHLNFAHQAHEFGRTLRTRPVDRVLSANSFAEINGLTLGVHLPLAHGAAICLSAGTPRNWLTEIPQSQATVFTCAPTVVGQLVESEMESPPDLTQIRHFICSNGRLRGDIRQSFEDKFHLKIAVGYGSTETCGMVTLNLFPHEENRHTVGEPLGGCEIAILNEDGQRQGAGKHGRIAVRGPSVMRGYRGDQDRTNEVLRDEWLVTDDFGMVDYQSNVTVQAAAGEFVLKGGFPVFASDVEDILREHPGIKDAAVIGITDAVYGEDLKACLTLKNGSNLSGGDVIQFAKERTSTYKCPRIVKIYKELPLTPGGKIKRASLHDEKA